jgi:hypothetical protein
MQAAEFVQTWLRSVLLRLQWRRKGNERIKRSLLFQLSVLIGGGDGRLGLGNQGGDRQWITIILREHRAYPLLQCSKGALARTPHAP